MNRQKLLPKMIGLMLSALLLAACGASEATPAPVPPTPTPELLSLQIGDTFTVNSYQVKLIQVEERPTVIAATSDRIGPIDPTQNGNAWLVLDIEVTNTGNEVSALALLASDAAVVESNDQPSELSNVGILVEEGKGFMLAFIDGQKLKKGLLVAGASGRIFILADGSQKLLVGGGARTVIGDPIGPQWDLGKLATEETAPLSLLFEIPAGASELTWQFWGSAPVKLPQPQTESLPKEQGPSMTISMTNNELCQVAETLELECFD